MFISLFRLSNYKSYVDSQELTLSQGINLIVGQNNAGKSALLEGLSLTFENRPYRDPMLKLTANEQREQESNAIVSFTIENEELQEILRGIPHQFLIPLQVSELIEIGLRKTPESTTEIEGARAYIEELLSKPQFTFQAYRKTKEKPIFTHIPQIWQGANMPIFPILKDSQGGGSKDKRMYALCHIGENGKLIIDNEDNLFDFSDREGRQSFEFRKPELRAGPDSSDFGIQVVEQLQKRIYFFQAQRTVRGKCKQEYVDELNNDASNLASFVSNIQKTPGLFRELNNQLRVILPQVYEVGIKNLPPSCPTPQSEAGFHEILVYQSEGYDERFAISLEDSGTGVGQVLAVLSIIIASKHSQTIIIDEPQSFLHPGAIRKLIDILRLYPQHQYIISTHAPQIITSSNSATITFVTKERGEPSLLKSINPSEQGDLTLCLENLGARLGDVFGNDQILWVEGQTESKCFPLIVEKLLKRPLLGTAIVHVAATGDLEGKDAERVIKIYERLSEATGLIPPTLGFIFDRENKSEKQINDLKRRLGGDRVLSGDRVRFLDRAMIENYFLNAEAIVSVIVNELGGNASIDKVEQYLEERLSGTQINKIQRKRYYPKSSSDSKEKNIKSIHAAHVLEDLFSNFAPVGFIYDKPKHGKMRIKWLIENQPESLNEIKELLEKAIFAN